MKRSRGILAATLVFLSLHQGTLRSEIATGAVAPRLAVGSKVWLVGDSTLHEFTSTTEKFDVDMALRPAAGATLFEKLANGGIEKLEVKIPIVELKSHKSGLDKNMQKSLKAEEFPVILFHGNNCSIVSKDLEKKILKISASGNLEVAGVKKEEVLDATVTAADGGIRIEGTKDLLMTDFGIKPPKMMMIKTENRVVIHFDLSYAN